MRINLKWLREHNYDVQQDQDTIEIYPRDSKFIFKTIQDEFGLERMYAFFVEEEIRDFQVLTDIRRAK